MVSQWLRNIKVKDTTELNSSQNGWYVPSEQSLEGFATPAYFSDQQSKTIILLDETIINFSEGEVNILDFPQEIKFSLEESGEWFQIIAGPIDQEIITSLLVAPCKEVVFRDDLEKAVIIFKKEDNFLKIKLLFSIIPPEGYEFTMEEVKEENYSQTRIETEGDFFPVLIRKK